MTQVGSLRVGHRSSIAEARRYGVEAHLSEPDQDNYAPVVVRDGCVLWRKS
jgi:hypothetical protein